MLLGNNWTLLVLICKSPVYTRAKIRAKKEEPLIKASEAGFSTNMNPDTKFIRDEYSMLHKAYLRAEWYIKC